ncbi:MAG: dienelactone hydrolase family protein [Acidobacteria bacterium]|nr:dienelactone hydrolase family protein [Acidobacteriota bacterium]
MDSRLEAIAAEYRSGRINRRGFMERLIAIAGSYPLAHHFLETSGWALTLLSPAESHQANVESAAVNYPGPGASLEGYWSQPKGEGPFPGLLLIHENRGLNEHIRDVARRLAAQGFAVLAVDQLSRKGGTASFPSPDAAREAIRTLTDDQVIADLDAAYNHLQSHAAVRKDRIGVMGFCWGGQRSFLYATANPNLKAAVVFYGSTPPEERLANIRCPVMAQYAQKDSRVTDPVPETAAAMQEYGKSFEFKIYPGVDHAFFNDTGQNYNEAAAKEAWLRTVEFLRKNLGS